MVESLKKEKKQQALHARKALGERLARAREREARTKQRLENGESVPKRQVWDATSMKSSADL
jgi:hypothetical protein